MSSWFGGGSSPKADDVDDSKEPEFEFNNDPATNVELQAREPSSYVTEFDFDAAVHIHVAKVTPEQQALIDAMRVEVLALPLVCDEGVDTIEGVDGDDVSALCARIQACADAKPKSDAAVVRNIITHAEVSAVLTDACLGRFMQARQWNHDKVLAMLTAHLLWRAQMRPHRITPSPLMSREGCTGKIRCASRRDRYGRPILILDNSGANSSDIDAQMRYLSFCMTRATRMLPRDGSVDRFVVFVHLDRFSMSDSPPWAATKRTMNILFDQFPERMGHAIVYQPSWMFAAFYKLCTPFMDDRTKSKITFARGDVSPGAELDTRLRAMIHDDWKDICGVGQPCVDVPGQTQKQQRTCPGYDHRTHWPHVRACEREWQRHRTGGDLSGVVGDGGDGGDGGGGGSGGGSDEQKMDDALVHVYTQQKQAGGGDAAAIARARYCDYH